MAFKDKRNSYSTEELAGDPAEAWARILGKEQRRISNNDAYLAERKLTEQLHAQQATQYQQYQQPGAFQPIPQQPIAAPQLAQQQLTAQQLLAQQQLVQQLLAQQQQAVLPALASPAVPAILPGSLPSILPGLGDLAGSSASNVANLEFGATSALPQLALTSGTTAGDKAQELSALLGQTQSVAQSLGSTSPSALPSSTASLPPATTIQSGAARLVEKQKQRNASAERVKEAEEKVREAQRLLNEAHEDLRKNDEEVALVQAELEKVSREGAASSSPEAAMDFEKLPLDVRSKVDAVAGQLAGMAPDETPEAQDLKRKALLDLAAAVAAGSKRVC